MKRIFIFFNLFLFSFFVYPQDRGVLYVQSEPDYPPFCIEDEEGLADGFSVELFKAAAEAMGYRVVFEVGPWNIIKENLAEGRINALPLVGRSPEREKLYDFTVPYHKLHGAVFVRKGSKEIMDFSDLDSSRLLVMEGDNADEYITRTFPHAEILRTDTFETAFKSLSKGEADAVIAQELMGNELLKTLNIKNVIVIDIALEGFAQDFSFAVKKGNSELLAHLNEGLVMVFSDGTYEELYKKWFFKSLPEMNFLDILKMLMPILIPLLIAVLIASTIVLKFRVRARTLSLSQEISERKRAESEVKKQLEEKNLLLKEVHHRIKNNFASIESLLKMESIHLENPEAKKALDQASSRVGSMRVLYEKLLLNDNYREISLQDYIKTLVEDIVAFYKDDKVITFDSNIDNIPIDTKNLFYIGILINEIITNSMKYAFTGRAKGALFISIHKNGNTLQILVRDNGVGLEEDTMSKRKGFGTAIVEMLCSLLNGSYTIEDDHGAASHIEIKLPTSKT